MKTANIVFLIDIQNGFARNDLTELEGGSLYVPGGEKVGEPAARLIHNLKNSFVVLSQDYHPGNHISFAKNHVGVRPFENIYLHDFGDGNYRTVGVNDGGKIKAVVTNDRGYISRVLFDETSKVLLKNSIQQTTWPPHCVQGTKSALIVDPVLQELPNLIAERVTNHRSCLMISDNDDRGNHYYLVRKGMRSDLDSYGISTENDGKSKTHAFLAFNDIVDHLKDKGVTDAAIYIGGLATNFCVEYSHADIYRDLIPLLRQNGINSQVHLLTDISAGIPIPGEEPDAAITRMAAMGTKNCTTDDVIRGMQRRGRAPEEQTPTVK